MTDSKLAKRLENLQRTLAERASAEVIQLPVWPEPKRGTPNSFIRSALFSAIQSKDRKFLDAQILDSQAGIVIKFTGQQLNQEDLTLWETLVHLAKSHALGNVCIFTAHGLLKAMGLNTGGTEHRRLHKGIIRLAGGISEITHEGKTYFGPLIKSGIKDELTSHYTVELNRELIRLYGETQWTAIDWQQRLELRKKPLAQALHAFYSSHKQPFPTKLATLQRLTGSRNAQAADFKRQCRKALDELVKIGFLTDYNMDAQSVLVHRMPSLAGME
jgi:hypothetical protein